MTREWDDYQSNGNSAKWRIENLNLKRFAGQDKTLLDIGANQGEFEIELSKDFKHITAIEPFVPAPKLPENISWFKKGFKEFITESHDTYDVVFSFATTGEIRNNDKLNEDQIVKCHYHLLKPDGIIVYETHLLNIKDGKPYGDNDFLSALISGDLNIDINTYEKGSSRQKHTYKMLKAFREQFGKEIESGNGRTFGKRKYYIFKKVT